MIDEDEHADTVTLGRLEWMADTSALLLAREQAEPGSVDPWSVMALHASFSSWSRMLDLDVPA